MLLLNIFCYQTFFQPTDLVNQMGVGAILPHIFSTDQFCEPNGGAYCYQTFFNQPIVWTKQGQVLQPNIFSTNQFCESNEGRCYQTFSTNRFCGPNRAGAATATNRLFGQIGAGAAAQPFFQPTDSWYPWFNPHPKCQPTNFWIQNRVGTANQNFYQLTN